MNGNRELGHTTTFYLGKNLLPKETVLQLSMQYLVKK